MRRNIRAGMRKKNQPVRGQKIEHLGRTYTFLEMTRKGIRVLNENDRIEHIETAVELPEK